MTERSSHPQDIVVAPLDIDIVILGQGIHDLVGAVAAVKNIPDDVQLIDDRMLNKLRDGDDKGIGAADLDNIADDIMDIGGAVIVLVGLGIVKQLIDDIGKIPGHGLSHLGAGIFAGGLTADLHQMQQGGGVPLGAQRPVFLLEKRQLFLRVVDKGGKGVYLGGGHLLLGEALKNLTPDRAGSIFQDMKKKAVFAVNIADKMLAPFGQAENGVQVNDLGRDLGGTGELLRKQLKVLQSFFCQIQGDRLRRGSLYQSLYSIAPTVASEIQHSSCCFALSIRFFSNAKCCGSISESGIRQLPHGNPTRDIAAFTGMGLTSQNRAFISGSMA